jgi:hypothetical protein
VFSPVASAMVATAPAVGPVYRGQECCRRGFRHWSRARGRTLTAQSSSTPRDDNWRFIVLRPSPLGHVLPTASSLTCSIIKTAE